MVAEGVFPKINGDILYASEVNRFANAGRLIAVGSGFSAVGTGVSDIGMGSFVFEAGSFTLPVHLCATFNVLIADSLRIRVSGIGMNMTHVLGSSTIFADDKIIKVDALLGSPLNGFIQTTSFPRGYSRQPYSTTDNIESVLTELNNLDLGSPFVLLIQNAEATSGAKMNAYEVYTFGQGW